MVEPRFPSRLVRNAGERGLKSGRPKQGKRLSWPPATPEVQGVRLAPSRLRELIGSHGIDRQAGRQWEEEKMEGVGRRGTHLGFIYRWAGSAGAGKSGQAGATPKQVTSALSKPDRAIDHPGGQAVRGGRWTVQWRPFLAPANRLIVY
ncbi:hypothetical protein VTN31DRAFT_4386 [Thermomyces dupontii]|uniref:uncharacterized protein n=1 Tax=Talaromyces thermophilus TaxID=28565 RepID=UPI003743E81D